MVSSDQSLAPHLTAARIVGEAGGELVGRTRLQKVACLAQLAGFLDEYQFEYRNFGPYSDQLAGSIDIAAGLGFVEEEDRRADWGGRYSIYHVTQKTPPSDNDERRLFIFTAAKIGAIELELAATAAFLSRVQKLDAEQAWQETQRRKPEKASEGRLETARMAYANLLRLPTPQPLPAIA